MPDPHKASRPASLRVPSLLNPSTAVALACSENRMRAIRFNGEKFRAWWNGLTPEQQEPYRAKARWEQRSLSAVISEWWPDVWAEIGCEDSGHE